MTVSPNWAKTLSLKILIIDGPVWHPHGESNKTDLLAVVHFILGPQAALDELPLVLQGRPVPSASSSIGSGDIASVGRVVILGGAFDEATIESLRSLCAQTTGARRVPWLRQDTTKPTPPLGPKYGKAMIQRTKETLKRLADEGKLDGSDGDVYCY